MRFTCPIQITAAVFALLLLPCVAQGHSLGIVRLREARGPFLITVFTSSELIRGRVADVSVLVQGRDSNEALLDAIVNFVFTPPRESGLERSEPMCGQPGINATSESKDGQIIMLARRGQSPNKLLYTASINFPQTGPWELEASVRHGADSVKMTCEIPVGLPARPLFGLVPYLALPVLLVALFAINQGLRSPYPKK